MKPTSWITIIGTIVVVLLIGFLVVGCKPVEQSPSPEPTPLAEYDRELFGDYDRSAILDKNYAAWPDCHGYYSVADDTCYTDASDVHVDHIVALKEAWTSGANRWTPAQREEFAGDPENLWLMTAGLNMSKSDDDLSEWLPPYEPAVCDYVSTYVEVKTKWNLSMDPEEEKALGTCGIGG